MLPKRILASTLHATLLPRASHAIVPRRVLSSTPIPPQPPCATLLAQVPTNKRSNLRQMVVWGGSVLLFGVSVAFMEQPANNKLNKDDNANPSMGNKFRFHHGATVYPHPEKEYKGGEDAYFVSETGLVIGVADGVGGWASKGVDPAIYARALMEGACQFSNTHPDIVNPVVIMNAGYSNAAQHLGSSTCCIVVLDGPYLNTANLGDSGFMIVRGDKILFRTKEQQHRFNFPFQLGNTSKDKPHHANEARIPVQSGDVVIVGTDGLFDNLYDQQILTCVTNSSNKQPQLLSQSIAQLARKCATRSTGLSPFSEGSTQYGRPRQGGKMDDITVVVGIVV